MKVRPVFLISCAALLVNTGISLAGPCNTTADKDAGSGPTPDPVFADYVKQLAVALGPVMPAPPAALPSTSALLLEPMTRGEIRVLHLLGEGYSNSAMAEKLFVSDSTIRTHLRNINTKLDSHSRTQAVALARRIGLIP